MNSELSDFQCIVTTVKYITFFQFAMMIIDNCFDLLYYYFFAKWVLGEIALENLSFMTLGMWQLLIGILFIFSLLCFHLYLTVYLATPKNRKEKTIQILNLGACMVLFSSLLFLSNAYRLYFKMLYFCLWIPHFILIIQCNSPMKMLISPSEKKMVLNITIIGWVLTQILQHLLEFFTYFGNWTIITKIFSLCISLMLGMVGFQLQLILTANLTNNFSQFQKSLIITPKMERRKEFV